MKETKYTEPFDQLYSENEAEICGLHDEAEEGEVLFENGGDVNFLE